MSDASTNITDPIFARAAATPHAIALIEGGTAFSYAAICAAAGRAAQAMLQAGRREGDVIGIAAQGSAVLQLAASLALARMGMTQAWLAPDDSAPLRAATVSRLGITAVLADLDPAWLEGIEAAVPRGEGGSRAWILTQSSGTTATPKTIFVSHSDEAARRARFAPLTGYRPGERYLGLPPLRFYVGLAHALRCLAEGGTLVVPRAGATPQEAIGAIELHDVTYLMCNAVQLENLLHELPAAGPRLPGLRVLRVITSALSPELLSRARQALTPNVFVSYGTNEAGEIGRAHV